MNQSLSLPWVPRLDLGSWRGKSFPTWELRCHRESRSNKCHLDAAAATPFQTQTGGGEAAGEREMVGKREEMLIVSIGMEAVVKDLKCYHRHLTSDSGGGSKVGRGG